jgi:poly(hydroxyalkanoate) granule-associated protein
MAARRKPKAKSPTSKARKRATRPHSLVVESVQQVWLAGMGAIAKAQKDGPAAFQDAVADGLKLLNRSRSSTEKLIRDAFEAAQASMQTRVDEVRDQAGETWDNLEALFQSRVQKALQQIGVPNAEEVRLLTRRVAELNDTVNKLAARPAARKRAVRRASARARPRG